MNLLRRRSIRFRLTAWYAGVLTLAIIVFAVTINTVLIRRLNDNFDSELINTANAIRRSTRVDGGIDGFPVVIQLPNLDPFSIAGYFVQVYNESSITEYRSESLSQRDLPLPDSPETLQRSTFETISIDGRKMRIIYAPLRLTSSDLYVGVLVIATSMELYDQSVSEIQRTIIAGSVAAIAVALLGGWLVAGRALRPVERMRREAVAIGAEGSTRPMLSERIQDPGTDDEISRLAQTFNELLDRIEAAFETERRFIADASHELRTPLTAIRGNVDVMLRQAAQAANDTPEQREALEDVQREAGRMSRLLEDLLTLARADANVAGDRADLVPASISEPVARAVRTAQALAPDRTIHLTLADDPTVRANADQIEQVVLILLDNAIRHSEAPSEVSVALRQVGSVAEIRVIDHGEGIEPSSIPHLFDRFYRVDSARSRVSGGTGLGLAIAHAIVTRSGGTIAVSSIPNESTVFTITLPIVPSAAVTR